MNWAPLNYLTSAGGRAASVVPLTWFTLIVSILVCLLFAGLILVGTIRSVRRSHDRVTVRRGGNGVRWIMISLALTAVPLLITLVWTMAAIAKTGMPPGDAALVLEVTPRQWWWEVRYGGNGEAAQSFVTANEIHIPAGLPVLVRLTSPDVIHSFWVPQLGGKTDAIPGQGNMTWLRGDVPGRYRGQCAEYCGAQHARMGFEVVVDTPRAFREWRQRQLQTAPPPATPAQQQGLALFEYRCALCHSVRGTNAHADAGPDLTHLMSRARIGAALLPNNRGALAGWVQSPQGVKPGALMPDQHLDAAELNAMLAYLETLR